MQDNSHQVSLQGDNIKKYHKNLKEWIENNQGTVYISFVEKIS